MCIRDSDNIGVHFELFAIDIDKLNTADIWPVPHSGDYILQKRMIAVAVSGSLIFLVALAQGLCVLVLSQRSQLKTVITTSLPTESIQSEDKVAKTFTFSHYALITAMLNSFLVGGITFGFSGLVLILRQEGTFSESCGCGSFCSREKEQLAFISTIGFAVAIGSRLFIGLFLDSQGPKSTAIICSGISLSGTLLLASTPKDELAIRILPAWILLCFGGSGLHLSGFHFTNLFRGEDKKAASAAISAAFGASSMIFPVMQLFNQYLDIELQDMAICYSMIVFLISLNNFLIQPWKKVQAGQPGKKFKPDLKFWNTKWWKRNLKKKPMLALSLIHI